MGKTGGGKATRVRLLKYRETARFGIQDSIPTLESEQIKWLQVKIKPIKIVLRSDSGSECMGC